VIRRRGLVILYLLALPLHAGELLTADVEYSDGRYIVEIDMLVDAPVDSVYRIITDYNNLTRIHENIKESELIFSLDDRNHRVRIVSEACITFFCISMTQVQDVEEKPGHIISSSVIADKSDFTYAHAFWRISAKDNYTRVQFNTDLQPKFWVPPLIGPFLIKKKIYNASIETILNLEELASGS